MRPGFINSFRPYQGPINPWGTGTPLESFEYAGNWSDTIDNTSYYTTFTGFSTPSAQTPLESFEAAGGWSGT